MQKIQFNFQWIQTATGLLALLGLILVGGCAGRSEDVYLLEETDAGKRADAAQEGNIAGDDGLTLTETAGQDMPETMEYAAEAGSAACIVHICGAVAAPGVYELPEGSRVMDAVTAGGGFLPEADQDGCNLAARIVDGCQIYIMTEEESSLVSEQLYEARNGLNSPAAEGRDSLSETTVDGKVNLNTADAEALKTLPGIGDSRAAAIIAWRQEHGRFSSIEDIMKVSGIKQAAFEKMKDKITV